MLSGVCGLRVTPAGTPVAQTATVNLPTQKWRIRRGEVRESGPLRAVHLSRHKWPGRLVNHKCPISSVRGFAWRSQLCLREVSTWHFLAGYDVDI